MNQYHYALVGHCKMASGLELGSGVFRYDPATGDMTHLGNFDRELHVGAQTYDPRHNRVYGVDEFRNLPGQTGGGGRVASASLDYPSGRLTRTSLKRTYATNPSYVTVDKTGRYLLVSHHCTDNAVTRMVKTEEGYETQVFHDLCTLLLYRLEENGDIGPIVDVFEVHGREEPGGHRFPHLHCVVPDPEGNFYIVCDKGLDKLYCFRIDYAKEKIVKCWESDGKPGSKPRYCSFHPTKPIFFSNCESSTDVNTYALDSQTGAFHLIASCASVGPEVSADISPSDIVVHPNGRFVYTSLRRQNLISVLEALEDGTLIRRQTLSCGGINPRGLCVAPDGRFLLCANMESARVNRFAIGDDGLLTPAGQVETGGFPGNLQILAVPAGDTCPAE